MSKKTTLAEGPGALPPAASAPSAVARHHRRLRRSSPWLVLGVVLVVGLAAYGTWHYLASPSPTSSCASHPHQLTIWTYQSLFDNGNNPNATRATFVTGFENLTGSSVTVEYLTGDLATALLNAKPCQLPDLVMGLDELEAPRVDAAGLLVPYASPELANVPGFAVADLSPDHAVTPYEFGYLGLDYNTTADAACSACFSSGDFFSAMEQKSSLAADLCYPDPLQGDITGEEFLAWEVEYTSHVLDQNWTIFWKDVAPVDHPQTDWGTGWTEFLSGACPTFVSYLTDPATEAYFGAGGWMNSTSVHHGPSNYSWLTDYGTGIVRGPDSNLTLDRAFVNWTLSGTVQSLIPTNEWMYPANDTVGVPGVYNWTQPFDSVTPVNQFTTPTASAEELQGWINELESIVLP